MLLEQRGRALRDSEARWRSLFEAIPEIVMVHDESGIIRHINRTGAERLGWSADDVIGRSIHEFIAREDGDDQDVAPHLPDGRSEAAYISRDGCQIPVEVNRCRMAFDGRAAVVSVARDVSVRHELARQQQNFLAMLTHDIKNPLAIVLGFTGLLGEVGDLNEQQHDLVARMQANANTVLTLVANYLNLTQIQTGKLVLVKKPVDVAHVLDGVVEQYQVQAERQDIALRYTAEPSLATVCGDAVALERVLTNLLHNALKFTGESGTVTITARNDGDGVSIVVSDTGIGIRADELSTIFQPYRRGTLRQAREGVGLGLFIAQSLIAAHQGRIAVESTPGQGTTFTVHLPAADPAPALRAAAC